MGLAHGADMRFFFLPHGFLERMASFPNVGESFPTSRALARQRTTKRCSAAVEGALWVCPIVGGLWFL